MSEIRSPGDYILEELAARGWTQEDLASVLGRSKSRVNEIVLGKQSISVEVATALASAFETSPQVWLDRETAYRLSLSNDETSEVKRRAVLFRAAPIKEMQKRGWIRKSNDIQEIESDVARFFEGEADVVAAFRKSNPADELTPPQKAWCFRVRQMAKALCVADFRDNQLSRCERALRRVAPYSPEANKVPEILAAHGIRFIVVEPLPGSQIDGMTTWLDDDAPVVGMSLRFDRIDSFWHTLCHEFRHVWHRDAFSIDTDFVADASSVPMDVKPEFERRADSEAAAMLIPPQELDDFIKRVAPFYSKERIVQFANRIKIHPGIIVGQLQHRGEIGYSANREMLAKIRHTVTSVAITDGWGTNIDPRTFQ